MATKMEKKALTIAIGKITHSNVTPIVELTLLII